MAYTWDMDFATTPEAVSDPACFDLFNTAVNERRQAAYGAIPITPLAGGEDMANKWQALQKEVYGLREFFLNHTVSQGIAGFVGWVAADGYTELWPPPNGFTRYRWREIYSLADPGEDGWLARFIASTETNRVTPEDEWVHTGMLFRREAGAWVEVPESFMDEPDLLTLHGLADRGDIITPTFLNELRDAVNLLLWTLGGVGNFHQSNTRNLSMYGMPATPIPFGGDIIHTWRFEGPAVEDGGKNWLRVTFEADGLGSVEEGMQHTRLLTTAATSRILDDAKDFCENMWADLQSQPDENFAYVYTPNPTQAKDRMIHGVDSHCPRATYYYHGIGPEGTSKYHEGVQIYRISAYPGGFFFYDNPQARDLAAFGWAEAPPEQFLDGDTYGLPEDTVVPGVFNANGDGFAENAWTAMGGPIEGWVGLSANDGPGDYNGLYFRMPNMVGSDALPAKAKNKNTGYQCTRMAVIAKWNIPGGFQYTAATP